MKVRYNNIPSDARATKYKTLEILPKKCRHFTSTFLIAMSVLGGLRTIEVWFVIGSEATLSVVQFYIFFCELIPLVTHHLHNVVFGQILTFTRSSFPFRKQRVIQRAHSL